MQDEIFPLISVGIPTYNGAKYLEEAVQSVLDQSYQNLEIIISDNCSTDDTTAIVATLKKKDARIKYFRQPSNIGFINNFNSIPLKAAGDLFVFFADDDIYDKDYIKLLWEEFKRNPAIVLAIGSIILITKEKMQIEHVNNFSGAKLASTSNLKPVDRAAAVIKYCNTREWAWGINLALYKKEVLLKHPYSTKMIDPGTLFCRSVAFEGDIGVNVNAIFYKRIGGLSGEGNYGRSKVTVGSKFKDISNQWLQLIFEFKAILVSKFSVRDKLKLVLVFLRYRFPALAKAIFLNTASFFVFILIKKPYGFIKLLFSKN